MRVLIAIDNDTCADALAEFVIQHGWPALTEFKIIHVIEPMALSIPDVTYAAFLEDISNETRLQGEGLLRRIAIKLRDASKSTHIEELIVYGHPKQMIIDEAEQWKADVIFISSHGKSGLDRLLLGSVSSAVVAAAPCSVLLLRPAREPAKVG